MIFDTDVVIWWLRGEQLAEDMIRLAGVREMSVISQMEVMQGVRSNREIKEFLRFLREAEFRILPVNEEISYAAAALIEKHALSHGFQFGDALIGATARRLGSTLATGNVPHFRFISGLEIKAFRPRGKRS